MSWNHGWIAYAGQHNERSAPRLEATPLPGQTVPSASLPQVWEPETVTREQATRAELTVKVAQAHGSRVALNAHGEVVVAAGEDEHEKNLADLLKRKGHPETQEQLHTAALEAGYSNEQSTALYSLYRAKYKSLPSVPDEQAMTFPPTTQATKNRDEQGMTFQQPTMGKKKPAADMQARDTVARDIQATLLRIRAISAGTSPAAAVRAPVRPRCPTFDMVAAARVMMAFMQAQGNASLRDEIAAAKREIQVQVQRIEVDRAARRLTGRA